MSGSGSQMQTRGPSKSGMCEYCHQHPKFPPYDYCSKACGSRAKASGSPGQMYSPRAPIMCKQCGQRPVFRGHEFCGKNCANTWQVEELISSGWNNSGQSQQGQKQQRSFSAMPSRPIQHIPARSAQSLSQGSFITGLANNLKSFVSPASLLQIQSPQSPGRPLSSSPSHMPQFPMPLSQNPLINPLITSPPPATASPMSPGTTSPSSPGSTPQYFTPSSSVGSVHDPNASSQTTIKPLPVIPTFSNRNSMQGGDTAAMMYCALGGDQSDDDLELDLDAADSNQDQMATSIHDNGGLSSLPDHPQTPSSINLNPLDTGGFGGGTLGVDDPDCVPSLRLILTNPMPGTCRLMGCTKPVFVDKVTNMPSEYCSHRHREDAVSARLADPCIMCHKMPRSIIDHFCSTVCRNKALGA